ncbi:unnamed protein product [Clonostachys byssicola]|uniref:WW domain-containing protein n=1 Tax=Clonostachys byssicola TaxID=160290 RepID=A0A9N9Y7S0_9HYPO|nr:unnamed protein product [Clonostachys byssicola]
MAAQFGPQPWASTPFCRALLFGSPFRVPSVSMGVIVKRPSPGQGAPTRLRRREPRRESQRLVVDDRQAQAQYPATQPDVYPDAGKPDPAQLQASNPKSPDNIAPDLRQASFVPPASLRGRRSTAEVDIIQVHGLAGHTIENTKTRIRDLHKRDPLIPWGYKRVADVWSHLRRSRIMQTHASKYLFSSTEDEMKEINERKTDQSKATDTYTYPFPDDLSKADFWIPQAAPDGRLFYYNTMTGDRSVELPLESSVSYNYQQQQQQPFFTDEPHRPLYTEPESINPVGVAAAGAAAGVAASAALGLAADYDHPEVQIPSKPVTPQRRKTDDEIMAIGRQLAGLAKRQNEEDRRARGVTRPSRLVSAAKIRSMTITVPNIPRDANGTAGGRETDWTRRYQAARKNLQLEPQKQQEKNFSIVPTISKDHTAGEQARQDGLFAELGRGEKRHLSRIHTDGEQHILDSLARKKPKRDK